MQIFKITLKKIIYNFISFFINFPIYLEAILFTPYLLFCNKSIWNNKLIFPFYHHSFGHNIVGLDCISRLFYPEKLSLILVYHSNINLSLTSCFDSSYDVFYFKYIINFKSISISSSIRYKVLKSYINLISIFKIDYQIINSFTKFYGVMSKIPTRCVAGDEFNDKAIPYINLSGYGSLIENNIGLKPRLPKNDLQLCINVIINEYPLFFSKPFVTLLLRSKGINANDISNSFRDTNQDNYLKSIEYITSIGYNIVATGDTDSSIFNHIDGFYDFTSLNISKNLLNVFLITECQSFIGQQSGPYLLANSSGKNCLLIDSWPYRLCSFLKGDINLYKNISIDGKEIISMKNLFLNHQDLCLGYGYKRKNAKVIDNSEDEILQSCIEFFSKNKFEEESKLKELIAIVPEYMPFKYAPSRPPSFILRQF
jgi:putative glycosyltransferase (TIGR04372 family)